MPVLRFQVTLHKDNGIPEDDVVNVWHFDTDQTIAEDADDIVGRLEAFYDSLGAFPWWAASLSGTADVKVYDMGKPPGRPIELQTSFTFPTAATQLPSELAVCVSFHGDLTGIPERVPGGAAGPAGDTRPRARRRGRIYLGPFSTQANFQGVGASDSTVNSELVTDIAEAVAVLAHGPDAGDGRLAVFSPTIYANDPANVDAATVDVTGGWVDNAWDIQRRRGVKASSRTLWTPS